MSAVATRERRHTPAPHEIPSRRRPRPLDGRAPTLAEAISGAWEDLVVEGRCACPACGAEMHAGGAGGRCTACCSELS